MSSTNLPNTKEKIFSWIFSKDYLQISEGACDWNPFIIFLQIFYCWFSFDFPLDFKIQSENHEKIYSKILWVIKKIISLVPRSEILRKSEFKIWVKIRIIQIHRTHVNYCQLKATCCKSLSIHRTGVILFFQKFFDRGLHQPLILLCNALIIKE